MDTIESICPGCKLGMPQRAAESYSGDFNASPECWLVFTEVLGKEYSNAVLFGQIHQLTVDAYAAQHAGGRHRDKSVVIHLCGLHLVLERGIAPTRIPPLFQQIAAAVRVWPHFQPPADISAQTVLDIALAQSVAEHTERVREWAAFVWRAWSPHHQPIRDFVAETLRSLPAISPPK
jgi:hypothetical protein